MTYNEIISKVADSTGLDKKLIDRTYKAYWRTIREHIKSLPLQDTLSEEEFLKLKPNVNIPALGKLYLMSYKLQKNTGKKDKIKN